MVKQFFTTLFAASLGWTALSASEPVPIYTSAPFPSAHASTVVELRDGDVMAAWFGGTAEGKPDVAIWTARLHDGRWSPPVETAREPNIATYNPVLFHTADRRLWLYYKFGPHPTSWSAARMWSNDDGKTWSKVEHLPAGVTGPIRTKPLIMKDGTVVSGSSVESYHSWALWIERSRDHAQTWQRFGPITLPDSRTEEARKAGKDPFEWSDTFGLIQPTVVSVDGKNHLRLYARSTANIGRVCVADSKDGGVTWTDAHKLDVLNPNSGIDAVHLRSGPYILIYNDSQKARTPLKLAISQDGEHFQNIRTIEDGPGEFSYPAMIEGHDGGLQITYTWNRKRVEYLHVSPEELHGK